MASSEEARDALYDRIVALAPVADEERVLVLARAWWKLQDDVEDADDSVAPMHATSGDGVTFGAGTDSAWYEDRNRIGFTRS